MNQGNITDGLTPDQQETLRRITQAEVEAADIEGETIEDKFVRMDKRQLNRLRKTLIRAVNTMKYGSKRAYYYQDLQRIKRGEKPLDGLPVDLIPEMEAAYFRELYKCGSNLDGVRKISDRYKRRGLLNASVYDIQEVLDNE